MKNHRNQEEKVRLSELFAMAITAVSLLILLSWMTERESFGMSETAQIAKLSNEESID